MNILRKVDWKVFIFYSLMLWFCFIFWLGIVQFVKLIARAMGWQ